MSRLIRSGQQFKASTVRRGAGFTLIEVMVALAVVAIALPALMTSLYLHLDNTGYLRDKALAQMVASNKLEELRIVSHARESLLQGRDSGQASMAGREWYWSLESQPTAVQGFSRIEIAVAASEEDLGQPLFTLIAFMSSELASQAQAQPEEGGDGGQDAGGNGDSGETGSGAGGTQP
jgi:general secretion pathway protein I